MLRLNEKTRRKLERFLDTYDTDTVAATINFMRGLDHAERMFAHEWLIQLENERWAEQDAGLEAAGS